MAVDIVEGISNHRLYQSVYFIGFYTKPRIKWKPLLEGYKYNKAFLQNKQRLWPMTNQKLLKIECPSFLHMLEQRLKI